MTTDRRRAALWISTRFATICVEVDPDLRVTDAPPLVSRWAVGEPVARVVGWARRRDPQARFVWLYTDGSWDPAVR